MSSTNIGGILDLKAELYRNTLDFNAKKRLKTIDQNFSTNTLNVSAESSRPSLLDSKYINPRNIGKKKSLQHGRQKNGENVNNKLGNSDINATSLSKKRNENSNTLAEAEWIRVQASLVRKQQEYERLCEHGSDNNDDDDDDDIYQNEDSIFDDTEYGFMKELNGGSSVLQRNKPKNHEDKKPLVDFTTKRYDSIIKSQKKPIRDPEDLSPDSFSSVSEDEDNESNNEKNNEYNMNSLNKKLVQQGERWPDSSENIVTEADLIEIVDEFGRTRLLPPRDAQQYMDVQRLKDYEKQEKRAHYDSKGEVRDMGSGFYQFSNSEEERAQQMSELKKLREETKNARKNNENNSGLEKDTISEDFKNPKRSREKLIENRIKKILELRSKLLGPEEYPQYQWLVNTPLETQFYSGKQS